MFTPAISSEIAKSCWVTSRAQPPAWMRRGETLKDDQKNGCVLTSVAGGSIWFGNWLSITGLRGPVIAVLAGSRTVLTEPSGGRSGLPSSGVSWCGAVAFESMVLSRRVPRCATVVRRALVVRANTTAAPRGSDE